MALQPGESGLRRLGIACVACTQPRGKSQPRSQHLWWELVILPWGWTEMPVPGWCLPGPGLWDFGPRLKFRRTDDPTAIPYPCASLSLGGHQSTNREKFLDTSQRALPSLART